MSDSLHLKCQLDHLVVCATKLDQGVSWFEKHSGVQIPFGGAHPLMGTHNHLTALSEDTFLEVIACDPGVTSTERSRWFNLDNEKFANCLQSSPCLTTWVVGVSDLAAALDAVRLAGIDAGEAVTQTRDDMQWQIALRPDGTLACDGVFPILIQWPAGLNPVSRMQDQGVRLNALSLEHPEAERIQAGLQALGADQLARIQPGDAMLRADMCVDSHHFQLRHHPIP